MDMELLGWIGKLFAGLVVAVIGGGVVSFFGKGYWDSLKKKIGDSDEEIKRLRDESIAKLEKDFKDHVKDDKSQQILTEMKNVAGAVSKIGDKVDNLAVETGKQGAEIIANGKYIENLDKSFQNHKEKHK